MDSPFNNLGLAITFSPTGKALLKEAKRLKDLFNATLNLIHVGLHNTETETLLSGAVSQAGLSETEVNIIWARGEPGHAILESGKAAKIDLLLAGALEKESILKYYIGSVARKIMRDADSSVLILKSPSEEPKKNRKFFVSTDFSDESEYAIRKTHQFALIEGADELVVLRDYRMPGLTSTVLDSGSTEEIENIREQWRLEEEEKMKMFMRELNLKGMKIQTHCLYGREGWRASNFVKENDADIYAISVPARKLKFIDRIFPHEAEYTFEQLPSNLLIVRQTYT